MICIAQRQSNIFKKFKEREKFITIIKIIKSFDVNKSNLFKVNIVKLINKYPKLMNLNSTIFVEWTLQK